MGVTIAELDDRTWFEFPGSQLGRGGRKLATRTYRAIVRGSYISFDRSKAEPPRGESLSLPLREFRVAVKALARRTESRVGGYGGGTFLREGSNVTYRLPCGEYHIFDLEDLLILADNL